MKVPATLVHKQHIVHFRKRTRNHIVNKKNPCNEATLFELQIPTKDTKTVMTAINLLVTVIENEVLGPFSRSKRIKLQDNQPYLMVPFN